MPERGKSLILWLLAVPTVLLFYASLFFILKLWYPGGLDPARLQLHVIHFSVIYAGWMVVLFMFNLFEPRYFHRRGLVVLNLASAMLVNLFVAVAYFYFQPDLILTPRRFLLAHVGLTFALLLGWYVVAQQFFSRYFSENLYLFLPGTDQSLVEELAAMPRFGFRVKGVVSALDQTNFAVLAGAGLIIADLGQLAPDHLRQLYSLRGQASRFYSFRQVYEAAHRRVYLPSLTELWFLENINYRHRQVYQFLKRLLDLLFGILGLAVFLATYPIIALMIKLTSREPVLFTQPRVGKYGTIFTVYKYRTMRGPVHNTWTQVADPRVTLLGKVLRRLRVDELPQCINLLKGDMSLVGPRPEQPHIVEEMARQIPFYNERHLVKPGLTGWGQLNVYARSVEETKIKLQYDLYYIKHCSLGFDLEIILKTVYHIFTNNTN